MTDPGYWETRCLNAEAAMRDALDEWRHLRERQERCRHPQHHYGKGKDYE
jgi:hypothetical protein